MKRWYASLLLLSLFPFRLLNAQSLAKTEPSANAILRRYIEARLKWAAWQDYSQFITWPDEPGWDCWWVASDYHFGRAVDSVQRSIIPVTYKRVGIFCVDTELEVKRETETVSYELVKEGRAWKIDGPIPDYPYVSAETLEEHLTKTIEDRNEPAERKTRASDVLAKLRALKSR